MRGHAEAAFSVLGLWLLVVEASLLLLLLLWWRRLRGSGVVISRTCLKLIINVPYGRCTLSPAECCSGLLQLLSCGTGASVLEGTFNRGRARRAMAGIQLPFATRHCGRIEWDVRRRVVAAHKTGPLRGSASPKGVTLRI